MAAAAARFRDAPGVDQVVLCSPDKDLAQAVVGERVVCWDRRRDIVLDDAGVTAKFGVPPASIPDWLALVGDSADGFPGIPGLGSEVGRRGAGPVRTPRRHPRRPRGARPPRGAGGPPRGEPAGGPRRRAAVPAPRDAAARRADRARTSPTSSGAASRPASPGCAPSSATTGWRGASRRPAGSTDGRRPPRRPRPARRRRFADSPRRGPSGYR